MGLKDCIQKIIYVQNVDDRNLFENSAWKVENEVGG
jgi:hypothetical protein